MGALALADLSGSATTVAVADPLDAAPPLLCRMVEAGLLGRGSTPTSARKAGASSPGPGRALPAFDQHLRLELMNSRGSRACLRPS